MRAVRFDRFGGPEVLELRTVPVPDPGADEVLVRVHASGLNPKDAMLRSRAPGPLARAAFPRATGFDFAGEVVRAGAEVTDLAPGQKVWGFLDGTAGGAAAEYLVVPRRWMGLQPQTLNALEAATLPLVGCAALQSLRDVARLRAGERILIKGASGGVGRAAVQIAKATGAHVTVLASGAAAGPLRDLGADAVVGALEGGARGHEAEYDVFLDCAGNSPIRQYSRLLRPGGRWVTVAPNVPVFVLTPLSWIVSRLGAPRYGFLVVRPASADLDQLAELVRRQLLRPSPITAFPLESVSAAHHDLARRGRNGRPVLVIAPELRDPVRELAREAAC